MERDAINNFLGYTNMSSKNYVFNWHSEYVFMYCVINFVVD